jgi:hypothetical protein
VAASNQNPLTDDERRKIRDLHAAGLSRNAIAKEIGRSGSTVSVAAKEMGLSFERGHEVEAATKAMVADAKTKRAELMNTLLDDAARLRAQIWEPHEYRAHGGRDFIEQRWTQEEPTSADKLKLMQAATIAVDRSLRLDLHDSDTQGLPAVDAWLRDMIGSS